MKKYFFVYILTNKNKSVLYIGMTNNLARRMYEHKNKMVEGFTKKYNINKLVYFETFESVLGAIEREKNLKKWKRAWKYYLVRSKNSELKDYAEEVMKDELSDECMSRFYDV